MDRSWWKEAIVYQIYPRSFYDANGDGIGDLRGLIRKLDYIKELGVDLIWLCPIYQSPNDDNGYDISDYYGIMKEFGAMEDFDELLSEMHRRGLRLMMDLVVNHTSDEHPWFIESRSSRDNPKRDFYIWREPKSNGEEPNNWRSHFTKSAWEWDELTGEYYLHLFSKKQPDLNWHNPEVRQEIYRMMKWWLDKGIDGFRMDVINFLVKPPGLPDAPPKAGDDGRYVLAEQLYVNYPEVHEILQEMNRNVLSSYEAVTVGETPLVTPELGCLYVNVDRMELNMLFHFDISEVHDGDLLKMKEIWRKWNVALKEKGWDSVFLNNHDQPRQVSHYGNDREYHEQSAKLLATLTLTLPGTPYIYQGEEIGMTNVAFPNIDDYRDISTLNRYAEKVERGEDPTVVLRELQPQSRDNARTPMQWNNGKNTGFTAGKPWIKVNPNYTVINVENNLKDGNSVLNYYKKLIHLRKQSLTFVYGDYIPLDEHNPYIHAYLRISNGERMLVVLNFTSAYREFKIPDDLHYEDMEILIANYDEDAESVVMNLRPWEARVYRLA